MAPPNKPPTSDDATDLTNRQEQTYSAPSGEGSDGSGVRDSRFATPAQLAELAWWKEVSRILFGKTDFQFIKQHLSSYWKGVLRRNEEEGRSTKFFTHRPLAAIVNKRHRSAMRDLQSQAARSLMSTELKDDDDLNGVFQKFRTAEILAQLQRARQEKEERTNQFIQNPRLPWPGPKSEKSIVTGIRGTSHTPLFSTGASRVDDRESPSAGAESNNTTLRSPHKQYHNIGSSVYANCSQMPDANWIKGFVVDYEAVHQGQFGEVRTYSVEFEHSGEIFHDIDEVFVESAQDFDWRAENYSEGDEDDQLAKGVTQVLYVDSEDRYMRERGFYEMVLEEGSVFCSIVPAMRAYDIALVRKDGSNVTPSRLNFPEQWTFDGATTPQDKVTLQEDATSDGVSTSSGRHDSESMEVGPGEDAVGDNVAGDQDGSFSPVDTTDFPPVILELAEVCATCCVSRANRSDDTTKLCSMDWEAVYSKATKSLKAYMDSKATQDGSLRTQNKLSRLVPSHLRDGYDRYFAQLCANLPRGATFRKDDWKTGCAEARLLSEELLELAGLLSEYKLSRKAAGTKGSKSGSYWTDVIEKASPRLRRLMHATPNFYNRPDKRRSLTGHLAKPFASYVKYLHRKRAKENRAELDSSSNDTCIDESDHEETVEHDGRTTNTDALPSPTTAPIDEERSMTIDSITTADDCPVDKGFFSNELLELAELLSMFSPRSKDKWKDVVAKASPNLLRMINATEKFHCRPDKQRALIRTHVEAPLRKPFGLYVQYLYKKRNAGAGSMEQDEEDAEDEEEGSETDMASIDHSKPRCPVDPSEFSPEVRELAVRLSSYRDPRAKGGSTVWPRAYQDGSARLRQYLDSIEGFHESPTKLNKAVPCHLREKFKAYRLYLFDTNNSTEKGDELLDACAPRENEPGGNEPREDFRDAGAESAPNVVMPPCPVDTKQFSPELLEIARLASSFDPIKKGGPQNQVWRHIYENASARVQEFLRSKAPIGVEFLRMQRKQKAVVPRHQYDDFVAYRKYLYQCHLAGTSTRQHDHEHGDLSDNNDSTKVPNVATSSQDRATSLDDLGGSSECPVDASQLPPELMELARFASMRKPHERYNKDNSIWPKVIKEASPRLRQYMASKGFDLTTKNKEKVLVPFHLRDSYKAYWGYLQAKRYGSSGDALDEHDVDDPVRRTTTTRMFVAEENREEDQDAEDDDSFCSLDISELSPELRELANLCSLRDRTVSGLGKQNFWTDVYNMASTEVKRYIDSVPGFYQSKWKRDVLVPKDVRQTFCKYQEFLVQKHLTEEGRGTSRKRRRAKTTDTIYDSDRRQRWRSESSIDCSDRNEREEDHVPDVYEWHKAYGDKSWAFDEEANDRWEAFCETVESHWTDLTAPDELDAEESNRRWLTFGKLHAALWEEFLNREVHEMAQERDELEKMTKPTLQYSDGQGSRRVAKLVDRYMDRRQHRLQATLDWLHAQVEWFSGRHKSLQLLRWYDFFIEVKEKCDEHRYIERGALTRHLKECSKVLKETPGSTDNR